MALWWLLPAGVAPVGLVGVPFACEVGRFACVTLEQQRRHKAWWKLPRGSWREAPEAWTNNRALCRQTAGEAF